MSTIAIIPARYASTRFPAKPLALLGGKPIIQHVYEQARKALCEVVVATDHELIAKAVEQFGGVAVMTSPSHPSGTDRVREAYHKYMEVKGSKENPAGTVVINIQGDEPFIQPSQIETLKQLFNDPDTQIGTLVKPFSENDSWEQLQNPNSPKVVINLRNEAVFFSRSVIPYLRGVEQGSEWLRRHTFYKHIGLYAYRADVLDQITALPPATLEKAESLEQLRWIENGFRIKVGETHIQTIGIDTPQDLEQAERYLKMRK